MSVYYLSSIVGGLLLGGLSDTYGRKFGLYLSMIGSAISYGIVGIAFDIKLVLLSRVLVGLVK